MKTRTGKIRLLALALAVVLFAGMFAMWSVQPAQAIIIVNSRTGMFTLTPRDAVRVHVVNTSDEAGIVVIGGLVFDAGGTVLQRVEPQRVPLGQATSFEYTPALGDGEQLVVRVQLRVDASRRRDGFIPTVEVFDRETGRTCWFVDYIIDDGDAPVR